MPELIIHGHFYQPPRENPWTGMVDAESSAAPFHDWNERIHSECYRPNAFVRVADPSTLEERIVNNYRELSFNFGPTLLAWMAESAPEVLHKIVEGDRLRIGIGHRAKERGREKTRVGPPSTIGREAIRPQRRAWCSRGNFRPGRRSTTAECWDAADRRRVGSHGGSARQ